MKGSGGCRLPVMEGIRQGDERDSMGNIGDVS